MGLSTAERNRRKRERKKREREEQRKQKENEASVSATAATAKEDEVEIEYVVEQVALPDDGGGEAFEAVRRFQERAAAIVVSDEDLSVAEGTALAKSNYDQDGDLEEDTISKRKIRDILRPSVAELKRRVLRPDLVETHDVTAADPEFLVELKSIPGTVPVPRHWGRKRKYLQGKVRCIASSVVC